MTKLKVGKRYENVAIDAHGVYVTVIRNEEGVCTVVVEGLLEEEVW